MDMEIDPATLRGDWRYPTNVRFGPGRIDELPGACRSLGMTRPLLVTDPGLLELPMTAGALGANRSAGIATTVYSDVKGNPVARNVVDGVAVYRENGCNGVIAFGGGSSIDAAKAIANLADQTRPIWDFAIIGEDVDVDDIAPPAPLIAVPTTAGTGSEVSRGAIIIDEEAQTKRNVSHPDAMPNLAIVDPELTLGLPADITAATGMDALSHNLEAYCTKQFHPFSESVALGGIRLIKEWLSVAVHDGGNLAARTYMMAASSMGAVAFQKGLGGMHAMSHPIGAVHDLHHGLTNGVVMPYVLAFNRPAIAERMTGLARHLDLPHPSFDAVLDWVVALRQDIGIPHTLSEVGIREEHAYRLAAMTAQERPGRNNPVPLGEEESRRLYAMAINGELRA